MVAQESEYLFNGDVVDRGQNGAEVLFTVLAFKCLFPRQVRVNRGNHECRQQNRIMGFEEEILAKYPGPNGRVLLAACQKVFDCLPLCALIHNKIFVVHGGLFSQEGVLLDHIRGISRKRCVRRPACVSCHSSIPVTGGHLPLDGHLALGERSPRHHRALPYAL
jgi:hypothetical protein